MTRRTGKLGGAACCLILIVISMAFCPTLLSVAAAEESLGTQSMPSADERNLVTGADSLLEAIGQLESANDAKCQSSANRFEDFLFGTPLLEEARQERVRLQKELIKRIWLEASRCAASVGEDFLGETRLRSQLDPILLYDTQTEGQVLVHFPGHLPIAIEQRRIDQYGSIAYSLRAILAVQQEFTLANDGDVLPLTPKAIALFRKSIDLTTLASLIIADREARESNEFEMNASRYAGAWHELVPDDSSTPTATLTPVLKPTPTPVLTTPLSESPSRDRPKPLALLDRLIEKKIAAYRAYNGLTDRKARALFITNSVRFYARTPIAHSGRARTRVIEAVKRELDDFGVVLVAAANERAAKAGHALIRSEDAAGAARNLLPVQIDEFEDVHVFPNLTAGQRVVLEAYDCDSFRDFGLHWSALKHAVHSASPAIRSPDPFAAESLAETLSQYGVLMLRLAGDHAKTKSVDVHLGPADLSAASGEIAKRALAHRSTKAHQRESGRIVSAVTSSSPPEAKSKYFTEVTASSGIDFVHRTSRWLGEFRLEQIKTPPTFSGGGVAAEDIDGDSRVDLLFVGGGGNALYLNVGEGRFVDVTSEAGIDVKRPDGRYGEARSPIIADFDNDGREDILITYANDDHRLFRNLGGHRFEDVSEGSGLGGAGLIAGPATVFDFDGDGRLDIYIGYFGNYLEGAIPSVDRDNQQALPNKLFRNLDGMRFRDVTEASGTAESGWTQAVSHIDFDRDGRQDIIVANDYGRNAFFRNLGDGHFKNVASTVGMTKAFHSMNVGVSDLNHDGFPDIYISNLATLVKDNKYVFPDVNTPQNFDLRAMAGMLVKEADVLYLSAARGGVLKGYEPSTDIERGATSTGWAWDAEFLDFDNDGDDDLYLVNGTNDFNAFSMIFKPQAKSGERRQILLSHSRESNVLFVNEGGKLKNYSEKSGADFVGNSRSSAYLDMDGDGDLDIAVNNFESGAKLLRNNTMDRVGADPDRSSWLALRLVGDPARRVTRDAIGAVVTISSAAGWKATRFVQCGSGYLSMNPKRLHFGLGSAEQVDVHITWPNGEEETRLGVQARRVYTIVQGEEGKPLVTGGHE